MFKSLVNKTLSIGCVSTILISSANANTISFGDLAIIGVSADGTDGYAVIALADWQAGDSFYIGDNGVNGTSIFNDEELWRVDINSTVTAGTVVILDESATSNVLGASIPQISTTGIVGTVYADGFASVGVSSSDALIAFTSTDGSATEAASTNLFYAASAIGTVDFNDNGVPRGLSETQGITNRNGVDLVYNGSITSGTREQLFAAFSDDSNYSIASGQNLTALNSITFAVIPEPSSILLSALGLFSLGLYRKR